MAEETMMNLKKKVLALQQGPRAQTLGAKDVMVQRVRVRTPASALVGGTAAERRVPDQFVIQDADPVDDIIIYDLDPTDQIIVIAPVRF